MSPLVALALRAGFFERLATHASRVRAGNVAIATPEEVESLVRAVSIAARLAIAGRSCLVRSLVLQWWLARRGVTAQLRIGVHLDGTRLDAHAWLEHEGTLLNDTPAKADGFAPLQRMA